MEIQELLVRLDGHRGSFPDDLLAEIILRREEAIPILLTTLEDIDRNPEPWLTDEDRMVHVYALYLLALFREIRVPIRCWCGYLFRLRRVSVRPCERCCSSGSAGRILASVSGGDTSVKAVLIENERVNEYVRSVAMEGMVSLVETGQRGHDEVISVAYWELFPQAWSGN